MERRPTLRGEPEADTGDSLAIIARELLIRLRQRADLRVRHALVIAIDLQAGYKPPEIRGRHALSEHEYAEAFAWEREELEAEGLLILWDLYRRWNGSGTFRGFAASRLGFRLIDAWRRLNRGSRSASGPAIVLSLDAVQAGGAFDERQLVRMRDFARVSA